MKTLHFSLNFFQERPLISNFGNFTTMTIVKLCCHNFSQSAYTYHDFFCLVFLIDLLTYPYQKNFPKMLVFQIVTICPLSLLSRSSGCPRTMTTVVTPAMHDSYCWEKKIGGSFLKSDFPRKNFFSLRLPAVTSLFSLISSEGHVAR